MQHNMAYWELILVLLVFMSPIKKAFKHADVRMCQHVAKTSTFYESLGSPKMICAPMVDQSELAWRLLTRSHGVDLCFTQMILAKQLLIAKDYRRDCMDWLNYENLEKVNHISPSYSLKCGISEEKLFEARSKAAELDRTLIVQLAGDNTDALIKAGKMLQSKAAAIDLNLGK